MNRFAVTLSVIGFFLLLTLHFGSMQVSDPLRYTLIPVIDIAFDADNGTGDSLLPVKKTSLISEPGSNPAFVIPFSSFLKPVVSESLIRAPPSVFSTR